MTCPARGARRGPPRRASSCRIWMSALLWKHSRPMLDDERTFTTCTRSSGSAARAPWRRLSHRAALAGVAAPVCRSKTSSSRAFVLAQRFVVVPLYWARRPREASEAFVKIITKNHSTGSVGKPWKAECDRNPPADETFFLHNWAPGLSSCLRKPAGWLRRRARISATWRVALERKPPGAQPNDE